MRRIAFVVLLILFPLSASAQTAAMQGFLSVRHCIMENDAGYCRSIITPSSYDLFDRFMSYKLMPCLPTDFSYESEEATDNQTMVRVSLPADDNKHYVVRLIFSSTPQGMKLDIPASLKRGLGDDWQNKIQLTEQMYLLMKQNMGDKLTCETLNSLVSPK